MHSGPTDKAQSSVMTTQMIADMRETAEKVLKSIFDQLIYFEFQSRTFLHTMKTTLNDFVDDLETKMLVSTAQLEVS